MLFDILGALFALFTASWVLCWLAGRGLPVPIILLKLHFGIVFAGAMLTLNWYGFFVHNILHRLCGMPFATKDGGSWRLCAGSLQWIFTIQAWLTPQIRTRCIGGGDLLVKGSNKSLPQHAFLNSNHCSNYDGYFLFFVCPHDVMRNTRTLYMKRLEQLPLWGAIYQRCGSYPVHFQSSEAGNFKVDAEKQQKVMERMDADMAASDERIYCGGFLEGALNKTPETIQVVRKGSVEMCMRQGLKIYMVVNHGCSDTWPLSHSIGGLPAEIVYMIREFEIAPHVAAKRSALEVADLIRAEMQDMMNLIVADKKKRGTFKSVQE